MTARPCFDLLLLTGPLAGTVLPLADGAWQIGGAGADLQLEPEGGVTVRLRVGADGVTVTGAACPCWIEGRPGSVPAVLPLYRQIDLAGIVFMLAPHGSMPVPAPAVRPRRRRAGALVWVLAGLVFGGGLLGGGLLGGGNASDDRPLSPALRAFLQRADVQALQPRWSGDGVVRLDGACAAPARLDALRSTLWQQGLLLDPGSGCAPARISQARELLKAAGDPAAQIRYGSNGRLEVRTILHQGPRWQGMAALFERLFPEGVIWRADRRLPELVAYLARERVLAGVSLVRSPAGLEASARLPVTAEARLLRTLGHWPEPVIFHALAPAPPDPPLPSAIRSIGGEPPVLQLADGTRLMPGGSLPDGRQLVLVGSSGIALLDDARLVFVPFAW